MNRKWLFAGTLAVGIVAMGLSSAALADDQYCARRSSQQNAYVDRDVAYGNEEYGSARPYDSSEGRYSREGSYGSPSGAYPHTQNRYSQPDSRYGRDDSRYGRDTSRYGRDTSRYGRDDSRYRRDNSRYDQDNSRYDRDEYRGQGYGSGVVHEDHTRTTFRLFPFPHIDKTIVHHAHPTYDD